MGEGIGEGVSLELEADLDYVEGGDNESIRRLLGVLQSGRG